MAEKSVDVMREENGGRLLATSARHSLWMKFRSYSLPSALAAAGAGGEAGEAGA